MELEPLPKSAELAWWGKSPTLRAPRAWRERSTGQRMGWSLRTGKSEVAGKMFEAGQIVTGAVVGYLVVSICESYFHRAMGHTSPSFRKRCRKSGTLGGFVLRAWYSHCVVHHFMTYRENHVAQFSSAEEEARLRRKLEAGGKGHIPAQDYGLRVGGPGEFLRYLAPTLPVMVLVFWLGGGWFSLGAVVPLMVMPLVSEFVHPLLHLTNEQARKAAPPLLKPLVATRYFRHVACHHWLHHRHLDVNFNLMLSGDYILGCHRAPTRAELAELAAMGL